AEPCRTLPYRLVYPSGSSAPSWRHEHRHRGRNEISPGQTLLCPSVPSAHTLSRSALRRYFLHRKAASSDQRAHGRPVRHGFRLGYGPEVRRKPFGFHLAMDTLPSSRRAPRGRRVPPGLLSTHPPREGAAGLPPATETPCWAHSPNRHQVANSVWQQLNLIRSFQLETLAEPKPRSRKRTYAYFFRSMRTLRFLLIARVWAPDPRRRAE